MSDFMKKQSIAFYLNVIAIIFGVAGFIATIYSNSVSSAYTYSNLATILVYAALGIVLAVGAIYAPNRWGNHDIVSTICVLGSIGFYAAVIGNIIMGRVLLISGLFSFNSENTVGWSVFYASIAAIVCMVVAILFLIVGSFTKSVRE